MADNLTRSNTMLDGPTFNKIIRSLVPRVHISRSGQRAYEAQGVGVSFGHGAPDGSVRVSSLAGIHPVYASYDSQSKMIVLTTSADKVRWGKDMSRAFESFSNLRFVPGFEFDTSRVEDMSRTFAGCARLVAIGVRTLNSSQLRNLDVTLPAFGIILESDWDFSRVRHLDETFLNCGSIEGADLSKANLPNLESAAGAFANCYNIKYVVLPRIEDPEVLENSPRMFAGDKALHTVNMAYMATKGTFDPTILMEGLPNPRKVEAIGLDVYRRPSPANKVNSHNLGSLGLNEEIFVAPQEFGEMVR